MDDVIERIIVIVNGNITADMKCDSYSKIKNYDVKIEILENGYHIKKYIAT